MIQKLMDVNYEIPFLKTPLELNATYISHIVKNIQEKLMWTYELNPYLQNGHLRNFSLMQKIFISSKR